MYLADNPKVTANGQVLLTINEQVFIGIGIRGKRLYKVNTQMILVDAEHNKQKYLRMKMGDDIAVDAI